MLNVSDFPFCLQNSNSIWSRSIRTIFFSWISWGCSLSRITGRFRMNPNIFTSWNTDWIRPDQPHSRCTVIAVQTRTFAAEETLQTCKALLKTDPSRLSKSDTWTWNWSRCCLKLCDGDEEEEESHTVQSNRKYLTQISWPLPDCQGWWGHSYTLTNLSHDAGSPDTLREPHWSTCGHWHQIAWSDSTDPAADWQSVPPAGEDREQQWRPTTRKK